MKHISEIGDCSGKTVFVRVDFNVPLDGEVITDDFRIRKAFATIDLLRSKGARIILASHIGDADGSLRPVAEALRARYPVTFLEEYFPNTPDTLSENLSTSVVLLENVRKYPEEGVNDEVFARHLASFADLYVNEAFPASHRAHASIVGMPRFLPSYAGIVFEQEVRELSSAFHPERPFLFVLGGAKFETKLPLIEKFFHTADSVFIGGALANDFLKTRGLSVGGSLVSSHVVPLDAFAGDKLLLPVDVIVRNEEGVAVKSVTDVLSGDVISDIGPESARMLTEKVQGARYVLWNGPLGNYEKGFKDGTLALAKSLSESEVRSIVGGGDTVASIAELGIEDKFSFISTGGGAMLDFLANETLPGIEALNEGLRS